MAAQARFADRYELRDVLGEGGMGVVFRAYDIKTKSLVALKTMRDASDPVAVELFSKEWSVLASTSHPNIVDIRDVGEVEENGQKKPFFVMPLLPGTTLAKLIETSSARLTVERVIGIITQVCRGLQAAHDRGLVHRDIKPSNIFVMDDDTAKIIDFGVAHLAGAHSVTGLKGTWQYMAPEQIDMRPVTPVADVFSLGVVCYETLTNRRPFAGKTAEETAKAIRERIPPPIFEINPAVSPAVSAVIHKAMAKQPLHRLSSAREFADLLQKAFRNELTERFDRSKIQPRIERAKKALGEADADFASEILTELETEGHVDPEISLVRSQIDQTIRQRKIRQLLETARTRVEQDEIPLALEKLLEVLEIDPENADALAMRSSIEQQRNERQIENWVSLARRHLDRHDFPEARQALSEALKIRPTDTVARGLLQDAQNREQEALRTRAEIEQLYGSAVNAYHSGEISSALSKLERLLEMGRQVPDAALPDRDALYQSLYKEVRSEHDSVHNGYEDARRQLAEKNFERALQICDEFLGRHPSDPVFQALKLEAVELRRQELSEYIAEIGRRADAETDLDRKLNIFKDACERYPNEQQFQQSLKLTRERRDLVLSIVAKARHYEEKELFSEALAQWDTLSKIYPRYPGIEVEVSHLIARRDQQAKEEAKARLIDQIDRLINQGDFSGALERISSARAEEPQDPELASLERLARQGHDRTMEAQSICSQAQAMCDRKSFSEAIDLLHQAQQLDPKNQAIQAVLLSALIEQSRTLVEADNWRAADPLIEEATALDSSHPGARALRTRISDIRRKEFVSQCLAEARDMQAAGHVEDALSRVETGLQQYPKENRLLQQQTSLQNLLQGERSRQERAGDLDALKDLRRQIGQAPAASEAASTVDTGIIERSQAILKKYPDDPEIGKIAAEIGHLAQASTAVSPSPANILEETVAATVAAVPVKVAAAAAGSASSVPGPADAPVPAEPLKSPGQAPAPPQSSPAKKKPGLAFYAVVVGALAILVGAAIIATSAKNRKPQPNAGATSAAPSAVAVSLHTIPPDATVSVDGETHSGTIQLLSNRGHDVVVSRPGYVTYRESGKRVAGDWNFTLEPEPVRLTFAASKQSGKILVDNVEKADIQGGVPQDLELPADGAQHIISIRTGSGELLSFTATAKPAELPVIGNLKPKDLLAVSTFEREASVYTGGRALKGNLAGEQPQPIQADGLRLTLLDSGENSIVFDDKDIPKISVQVGNAPAVFIGLNAEQDIAYLTFQCNVPAAHFKVDGVERKPLKPGKWRLLGLKPGPHSVTVAADGFEPYTQQVELTKGNTLPLNVQLKPVVVTTASLNIENGTPGAQVIIDGVPTGVIDSAGHAAIEVQAGEHKISFRKQDYENSPEITRSFAGGQQVRLENEARLTKIVAVAPPPPKKEAPKPAATPVIKPWTISSLFEDPTQIELAGPWWKTAALVDYVFLKPGVAHSLNLTYSDPGKNFFGKKRKVEWVLSYVNNREKVVYEYDWKKLERKGIAKGQKDDTASVACEALPGEIQFTITVESSKIVVRPEGCEADTYEFSGRDLRAGQIGIKPNPNANFIIRRP